MDTVSVGSPSQPIPWLGLGGVYSTRFKLARRRKPSYPARLTLQCIARSGAMTGGNTKGSDRNPQQSALSSTPHRREAVPLRGFSPYVTPQIFQGLSIPL